MCRRCGPSRSRGEHHALAVLQAQRMDVVDEHDAGHDGLAGLVMPNSFARLDGVHGVRVALASTITGAGALGLQQNDEKSLAFSGWWLLPTHLAAAACTNSVMLADMAFLPKA